MDFGICGGPGTNAPQILRDDYTVSCFLFEVTHFIPLEFSAKYLSLNNHSLSVVLSTESGAFVKKVDTLAYHSNNHPSVFASR